MKPYCVAGLTTVLYTSFSSCEKDVQFQKAFYQMAGYLSVSQSTKLLSTAERTHAPFV